MSDNPYQPPRTEDATPPQPPPPRPPQRQAESTVFVVVLVGSVFGASLLPIGPAVSWERVANGIGVGLPFGVAFGGVAALLVAMGRTAIRPYL